jgi:DMSO/TMAO reductase YedYZ molybdopterin-dependent catalytic subunit
LKAPLILDLDDLRSLPRVEMVTELKCVEGWSVPVLWAGARLADFAAKFGLASRDARPGELSQSPSELFRYVQMSTPPARPPDHDYFVGLDIESALHPQSLLCYEMDGAPLTSEHGAPLRLAMAVKYGFKSIKRIGAIRFTDERPDDFWARYGYDWYAGH